MNICIFCGARPNFIKVAPLIRKLNTENTTCSQDHYTLVYAGSEDDPTLEETLFADLGIHRPHVCLGVECENLNELTGQVMSRFEVYLQQHPTDAVVVVDDLASTMAAAIVTKKQGVLLAHIAAGTRSFDITMPKEINRLVIDGLSDLLFTAGISNNSIANREGAELSKVYMVGNILMDNIRYNHARIQEAGKTLASDAQLSSLIQNTYLVFTLNRKRLIHDQANLEKMLIAINDVAEAYHTPVVAPLRSMAKQVVSQIITEKGLHGIHLVEPQGYLEFGYLTSHAQGIITDSGNVAEEATFNGVPCITLNSYTEHIETVKPGSNVLVGEDAALLRQTLSDLMSGQWKKSEIPERWDGRTAERILSTIQSHLSC